MASSLIAEIEKSPQEIMANKITNKLDGLGIRGASISHAITGPIITGYPIKLGNSTPVSKILNKNMDIAIACGVESVDIRIVNGEVIIYVPNKDRKIVDFKDAWIWFLKDEKVNSMELPILLGMDAEGNNSAIDLAEQPHILIAGSTGSGKSIFESSIIAAIATKKSKEELEIYAVDTKRVDLTLFAELPHMKRMAKTANEWYILINQIYSTVQIRNELFEQSQVRNIREYNNISEKRLPYILVIIDELADLIEKDKINQEEWKRNKEEPETKVIDSLRRLIQICRASGVHIIACTQRTSVDIISGTVKANFPTRISLRLPSSVDSRVILGQNGAENLLGKGDMLVQRSDSDILERYHAPFVRLEDIKNILAQADMIKESLGLIG